MHICTKFDPRVEVEPLSLVGETGWWFTLEGWQKRPQKKNPLPNQQHHQETFNHLQENSTCYGSTFIHEKEKISKL